MALRKTIDRTVIVAAANRMIEHLGKPCEVRRLHSGTEDGALWYVTDSEGIKLSDGGWLNREDADIEAMECDSLNTAKREAIIAVTDSILHDGGGYAGFAYTGEKMPYTTEDGWQGTIYDESRKNFY